MKFFWLVIGTLGIFLRNLMAHLPLHQEILAASPPNSRLKTEISPSMGVQNFICDSSGLSVSRHLFSSHSH